MLYQSTYYSGEPFSKPAQNTGSYEYLVSYARRMLEGDSGTVEIRDAEGTLRHQFYVEAGEIREWVNEA